MPWYIPESLVLAVGADRAVLMKAIACYPTGFGFTLDTLSPFEYDDEEAPDRYGGSPIYSGPRPGDVSDKLLRFGIEYSNGKRITTLDRECFGPRSAEAGEDAPRIGFRGGRGGAGHWSHEVWVWPLPPEGPVTFACEWPWFGIAETKRQLEGKRLLDAAEKAKPIFS